VLPFRVRLTPPGVKHLPWGRLSLFATSALGVLCATGDPFPATLPSSAFLTPLTVFSAAGLVGLFHPTATSRVSLQGLTPPTQPSSTRRRGRALSSVDRASLPAVAHELHVTRPRPQGLLSVWESAIAATVFSRRLDPIPSWAFLLQVFALDAVETPSRPLPLVAFVATLSSHCHH
jgi:hypothetical protein